MDRLGNMFYLVGGGTPTTSNKKYWGSGTPWISSADIDGKGHITYRREVTPLGVECSTTNVVPKGTVLVVTRVGLGKVAQLTEDTCFSQDVQALVAKKETPAYSSSYLMYQLLFIMQSVKYSGRGTTISGITKKQLADVLLYFPPLPEQERIVARIEELFSQLDAGVETLKKTKAQLVTYRQAVLKEAFEDDYPMRQLRDFSRVISGYAFKSNKYTKDGDYIVVKIGNVKERHFDFSRDLTKTAEVDDAILEKYLLRRGDCVITLTGSRGKRDYGHVSMVGDQNNYLLNQRVAALRFNAEIALPEYFQYYLASPIYRDAFFSYETGNVGQGNVGVKALSEPLVPLPDIATQKRIVSEIESRLSVCDSIVRTIDAALQQAEAMRQSILKDAFEGRL